MRTCFECSSSDIVDASDSISFEVEYGSDKVAIAVTGIPSRKCRACGTVVHQGDVLQKAELRAAAELFARGLRSGGALRFVRKAIQLTAKSLGAMLEVDAATISRWENSHFDVPRPVWITVGAIVHDRLSGRVRVLDQLRAIAEPRVSSRIDLPLEPVTMSAVPDASRRMPIPLLRPAERMGMVGRGSGAATFTCWSHKAYVMRAGDIFAGPDAIAAVAKQASDYARAFVVARSREPDAGDFYAFRRRFALEFEDLGETESEPSQLPSDVPRPGSFRKSLLAALATKREF